MYKPTTKYDQDFLPLEERTLDRARMMLKVHIPIGVNAKGCPKSITVAEVILNWQYENALAQNRLLWKIEHKVDIINTNMNHMVNSFSNKVHRLEVVVQERQRKIEALHHLL